MDTHAGRQAAADEWPEADLEFLGVCPCCGSKERRVHVDDLRDFLTGAAPGSWRMWRCENCNAAYLDPRPSAASMGRAYAGYYTHTEPTGAIRALVDRVKFEIRKATASQSSAFQYRARNVPRAPKRGLRVLDVGFGGGDFLRCARWLGYDPVGIDFDPETVKTARAEGFDVRLAGVPNSGLPEASFAHITMSNVLEHLPEPVAAMEEVFRLLQPGGRLWINQPNLGALGEAQFGRYWRGYEAPRHLTLWAASDLAALLERIGFVDVAIESGGFGAHFYYFRESELQRMGHLPGQAPKDALEAAGAEAVRLRPADEIPAEHSECLTIHAYRAA